MDIPSDKSPMLRIMICQPGVLMASEEMHALPEADPKLAGESVETGKGDRYHIKVSNAKGYLCHIHMEVRQLSSFLLNGCTFCRTDLRASSGSCRPLKCQ